MSRLEYVRERFQTQVYDTIDAQRLVEGAVPAFQVHGDIEKTNLPAPGSFGGDSTAIMQRCSLQVVGDFSSVERQFLEAGLHLELQVGAKMMGGFFAALAPFDVAVPGEGLMRGRNGELGEKVHGTPVAARQNFFVHVSAFPSVHALLPRVEKMRVLLTVEWTRDVA